MSDLVAPAADAAAEGVPVTPGFARVCGTACCGQSSERSTAVRDLFSVDGRPMAAGDTFRCEALASTLRAFGHSSRYFEDGEGAQAFLEHLGDGSRMTAADLSGTGHPSSAFARRSISTSHVVGSGTPSAAGVGIANTLAGLESVQAPAEATGTTSVRTMVDADVDRGTARRTLPA